MPAVTNNLLNYPGETVMPTNTSGKPPVVKIR